MTKRSGLGAFLLVGGVDLSGDTCSIDALGCPRGTYQMNGLPAVAQERQYGKRDGNLSVTTFYNKAAGAAHATYKTLPTADLDLMTGFSTTIGEGAASIRAKQIGYNGTREADGQFKLKVDTQSNGSGAAASLGMGLEYGRLLTAGKRTDTAAANGASVDFGVGSSTFGLRAWLQVTAFTGTDVTIKLQESSDDGVGDAFANVVGGAFTAVTAGPTTERIETSAVLTVERYLRVATTTVGGFTSCTFAVMVYRNESAVV